MGLKILKGKGFYLRTRLSAKIGRSFPYFFAKKLKRPIFIIGCGRSGTTLLSEILGKHRDVAHWSEANDIWYPQWHPWRPENIDKPPLEFDPVGFTNQWWQQNENRQLEIKAMFGAFQLLGQKSFFLNKSPYNVFRIPYLLQMFPEARFIHIIRDGRAVVFSYARKLQDEDKLKEWPTEQRLLFTNSFQDFIVWLAEFWKKNLEEVSKQDQASKLREKGLLFELSYEELCANPVATVGDICNFLDLPKDGLDLSSTRKRPSSQNQKWRDGLEAGLVARISLKMQPLLQQRGYS